MSPGGWAYLGAFAAALALAWGLTPLVMRLAVSRGVLDVPRDHKTHMSPIPYLGGVAIVASFSLAVLIAALVFRPSGVGLEALTIALAVGLLLALMGLVDDLRGVSALLRLLVEALAGVAVWASQSGVSIFHPEPVNLLVTVLWVVGITNAFNLLDNMDGLSAGLGAIAAGTFFVLALIEGQFLVAALAAALAGCALGFLRHNFHPARIYMGDAGSLFLGFMLAFIGIRLRLVNAPPFVAAFVPVVVLGVAVFDTTLVVINRLRHRRSPFSGGADHTSHRLVFVGIPVPAAVALIYGGAVSFAWLAVTLSRSDTATGVLLVTFLLFVGTFFGTMLSLVPVYENSRRRRGMLRVVREHEPPPPPGSAIRMDSDPAADGVESASGTARE